MNGPVRIVVRRRLGCWEYEPRDDHDEAAWPFALEWNRQSPCFHSRREAWGAARHAFPNVLVEDEDERKPERRSAPRPTVRDFAKAYLRAGWSIFPVGLDKRPTIDSWKPYQERRPTQTELDSWWPRDDPDRYGIAVVCGKLSNLAVLDADGATACAALRRLSPTGAMARSGGGGLHAFYRWSGERSRNRLRRFSDGGGLDLKAEGGYIILPPSAHASGGRYRWERIVPLPPLPAWVGRMLAEPASQSAREQERRPVSGIIPGGTRHDRLVVIAGGMHARGESAEAIADELRAVNETRCSPPMGEQELRRELDGIIRYLPGWSR